MNKLSKGIVLISAAALTLGLAACGSSTNSDAGHVYFLNNKPEVVDQWNELADMYTKETGVQVDIQSATSGSYESTLSSELAKNNAPTMFGIGGFDQYAKYKNYLEPLQDSEAYKLLNEQGIDPATVACKTGTAEYTNMADTAWFACYAPVDDPQYVVACVVEHGGGGSAVAAPLGAKVLAAALASESAEDPGAGMGVIAGATGKVLEGAGAATSGGRTD